MYITYITDEIDIKLSKIQSGFKHFNLVPSLYYNNWLLIYLSNFHKYSFFPMVGAK